MERHLRVNEVAELTGLAVATIRKRILRREIGYRKANRAIMIPESEVARMMGVYRPPLLSDGQSR